MYNRLLALNGVIGETRQTGHGKESRLAKDWFTSVLYLRIIVFSLGYRKAKLADVHFSITEINCRDSIHQV